MKALIVSDIHGRLLAARKIKSLILKLNPEKVIYLGDLLYNGPRNGVPSDYDPMGVSEILNEFAPRSVSVRGNCDSRIDQTLLKFPISDDFLSLELDGHRVHLLHGDLLEEGKLDVRRGDIVMSGHTHVYRLFLSEGVTYLNPGSPSFPKNGNPPTYAVYENGTFHIRKLDDDLALLSLKPGQ